MHIIKVVCSSIKLSRPYKKSAIPFFGILRASKMAKMCIGNSKRQDINYINVF